MPFVGKTPEVQNSGLTKRIDVLQIKKKTPEVNSLKQINLRFSRKKKSTFPVLTLSNASVELINLLSYLSQ